jgi:hypothetical protein
MIAESVDEIERELRESTYRTKTHGERTRPAARPAGEGIYALISADHRLFLAYELDLPETGGAVQSDLKIPPSASFALSVKNPEKPAPPDVGLRKDEVADYPKAVQREFRNRRFASEDGRMLDFEGAEFVIVGARLDPERELAIEFESDGTPDAVNILREHFQGRRSERWPHPVEPLIRGEWR